MGSDLNGIKIRTIRTQFFYEELLSIRSWKRDCMVHLGWVFPLKMPRFLALA